MRQIALLILVLGLLATAVSTPVIAAGPAAPFKDGTVLVGFRSGVDDATADAVDQQEGGNHVATVGVKTHVVKVGKGQVAAKIASYKKHSEVAYAEPDYLLHTSTVPNDPSFGQLWGMQNTGQSVLGTVGTPGADIKAEPAWSVTKGTKNVVVGVVDTGIDYTHPDLAANVWSNPGGIGGCPTGSHGYNAITSTCDPMDDNNHGSHVSGTIGAVGNNGIGVVGVNWTTSIMALKFLDASGSGYLSDAISAIDFAVQAKIAGVNVRVLSNSWGGGGFSQALLDEINKASTNDILFVAAAGNASANIDVAPSYPASYNTPNMIAVAATDENDGLAYFSNYGATSVHLGAPGTNILSTVIGGAYDYYNGTSMATPHVSGAAALILSMGYQSVAKLKNTILSSVDPDPALTGITVSGGRLNVCKAIPGCGTAPPPAPDFSLSANPTGLTVTQGGAGANSTVTITRTNGFVDAVSFTVSGLPSGATGTFNPATTTTSGTTSILTVTPGTGTTTPTGTYPLTITGTNPTKSLTRTTSVTLVVNPASPPPTPDFSLSATPASQSVVQGAGTTYTVTVTPTNGFNSSVSLRVSGLPVGATATFSPNPFTSTSTLSVATTVSTPVGSYPLTITGTSGSLTRTTTVTLVVTAVATCVNGDGQC